MKYSFKNDYSEGAHPRILEALIKTNFTQQNGYGLDDYCKEAENLIKEKIKSPDSKIYFVSGGTQANLVCISAFLRPHESVVAAETAHIFTNETAAIEATGHKIHSIITSDGKVKVEEIQQLINLHQNVPHQVKQKLVYISNATELGTTYTKTELENLYQFCQEKNLFLFLDGARLGQAIMSENSDLSLEDVAKNTDAFYLGGTKNGALIGEAIVINNIKLQEDFGFHLKQKGALLAKGRILGIQFLELFKDDLYFELAKHANEQAMKIKKTFEKKGIPFLSEIFTNQIFPILKHQQIEQLNKNFDFYVWKKISENQSAIRIITSWNSDNDIVNQMVNEIENL